MEATDVRLGITYDLVLRDEERLVSQVATGFDFERDADGRPIRKKLRWEFQAPDGALRLLDLRRIRSVAESAVQRDWRVAPEAARAA